MEPPIPADPRARARLHVVSGKGGTGKTTVASALGLALASRGQRVLLVEIEGRQGISQTFDVPPLSHDETRILTHPSGGELSGMSVDATRALMEYLQKFYRLGRAGSVLERIGAVDFATTVAPGLRDVLLIGKVYEAVGRPVSGRARGRTRGVPAYDAVILDAPPTGRLVRFLNVNSELAHLAKVGPVRAQADSITRMLRNPATAVHLVTLLEEMPVQETVDAIAELREAELPVGAIVVNRVHEPALTDKASRTVDSGRTVRLAQGVAADLRAVGVDAGDTLVEGLLDEAREHGTRVALQTEQEALVAAQGRAVYHLPPLAEGLDAGGIAVLADELARQGMA